jgi:predicted ATPase
MEALAMNGDYVGLLQSYREFRLYLHEELQTTPSEETVALYQRLREPRAKGGLHPPSESRLSPPADLLAAPSLPCPLTPLIGREQEITEVIGCLNVARLVTLTGTGGIGKTRLALAVGESVADDYADGVFFVDLAPLSDSTLVPQAVATALQIKESPPQSLLKTLLNALCRRNLLLILDNCEHLREACAELAQALLSGCPALRILATSRQPLSLPGERQWRVPSLATPPPEALGTQDKNLVTILMEYSAVQLFVERVVGSGAVFALTVQNLAVVAQICRRLEGIPLAIELAAARARSLSVEEVNAKLDNYFRLLTSGSTALPRQQTLRALIDWSYALLNPQEKTLLHRLSVFSGGWTLEAAEQVGAGEAPSGETIEEWETLDLLTGLVDKSLALAETREGHTRYRLLETVRQYAHERLLESGEAEAVRSRHCDYFLSRVHTQSVTPSEKEWGGWQSLVERDYDNVRGALNFCLDNSAYVEAGLWAAVTLFFYWRQHSLHSEGYSLLQAFLSRPEVQEPTLLRGQALRRAGSLALWRGEYATAILLVEEGLTLSRQHGESEGVVHCLNGLGGAYFDSGQPERARLFYEEGLAVARELELSERVPSWLVFATLSGLSNVCRLLGEYEAARRYAEVVVLRDQGGWEWHPHLLLANLLVSEGRLPEARERYLRSLSALRSGYEGQRKHAVSELERLAALDVLEGRWEQAALLLGACEAYREVIERPVSTRDHADYYDAALAGLHAALDADAFTAAWEKGHQMTFSQALEYALEETDVGTV